MRLSDVKAFLDTQGKNKVRIGQFIGKGPEAIRASASPLLREALKIDGATAKTHFVLGVILLDKLTSEARDHLLRAANEVRSSRQNPWGK